MGGERSGAWGWGLKDGASGVVSDWVAAPIAISGKVVGDAEP